MSDDIVVVRRQPTDYRTAEYLYTSFENPEWHDVSGGVRESLFGQSFIYGYVMCDEAIGGEVAHSGQHGIENHGPCPHRIKVCALKKDNDKEIYKKLCKVAGPRPAIERAKPKSGNTCKKDILIILSEKKEMRGADLIDELLKIGHWYNNTKAVLKKLCREKRLTCIQDPSDKRYKYYILNEK